MSAHHQAHHPLWVMCLPSSLCYPLPEMQGSPAQHVAPREDGGWKTKPTYVEQVAKGYTRVSRMDPGPAFAQTIAWLIGRDRCLPCHWSSSEPGLMALLFEAGSPWAQTASCAPSLAQIIQGPAERLSNAARPWSTTH